MVDDTRFTLLLAEDEAPLREGLADVLRFHGFTVKAFADGAAALRAGLSEHIDLAILDVMLPGQDGFSVCRALRDSDREIAILMLTARVRDEDAIEGLSVGADDYIRKPFSIHELVLRVQALLRRTAKWKVLSESLEIGSLRIDPRTLKGYRPETGRVGPGGQSIEFTRKEINILRYMKQHGHRPVSREELLREVWGYSVKGHFDTRTVDIHIAKLRRKIEPAHPEPQLLITIRGQGYQLVA